MQRSTLAALAVFALASSTLNVPLAGAGEIPGPHPAYIHALHDLRAARVYLHDNWAWAPVRQDDNRAIREIDAAIGEIRAAAIDDRKNLGEPEPIDAHLTPQSRFARANELLYAAHQDLDHAEDLPQARGLRDRAIAHVDAAHHTVDTAVRTARWQ